MKKHFYIVIVLAFILASCEPTPEPTPEPLLLSSLILGSWENKIYETGNEYYYVTFSQSSFYVQYTDGQKSLNSDAGGYYINNETNEVDLDDVLIRDYEAGRVFTFSMAKCYVTMSNENNTMTWSESQGNQYIFNRN